MTEKSYDLCIIGGGINGAGIARDAAARGLSVVLLEAKDLASATSSNTSKMLHGGLRYLEYGEFSMVREALKEREILMHIAPHISQPMDFILPDMPGQRPAWQVRLGLIFYDFLAQRKKLKSSRRLNFKGARDDDYAAPLKGHFQKGFRYSDGYTDDARLVILNAKDAAQNGAKILTHSPCTGLSCEEGVWNVSYGAGEMLRAGAVVNAAGPFVDRVLKGAGLGSSPAKAVRLVKGSHIIVPKQYEGEHSYLLQHPDGRVVFVWPYRGDFTLIGTTEEDYEGDPHEAEISQDESDYLIKGYNAVFEKPIAAQNIVSTFSGVRPLFDDGAESAGAVSRDFYIHHHADFAAPLLSIYGGKLTTYRVVAEQVVDAITDEKERGLDKSPLPGGDIPGGDLGGFIHAQQKRYNWLPQELVERYGRTYGTCMDVFLKSAGSVGDMGQYYGAGLYEREIEYLVSEEFARSADDVLWRRTKQGLYADAETVAALEERLER